MTTEVEIRAPSAPPSTGLRPKLVGQAFDRLWPASGIFGGEEPGPLTAEDAEMLRRLGTDVRARRNMPAASEALSFGRTLMGCYRARDFADADVFATALTAAFAEYPVEVCRLVVDPVCGLPSKLKFPPSIAEVHEEARLWQKRFRWVEPALGRVLARVPA